MTTTDGPRRTGMEQKISMYNIDQLNAMEEERVRSIASEMGMKKTDSAPRQEVEYYILDNQAITSAKEIAEKSAVQTKKRGRRPKKESDNKGREEKPSETGTPATLTAVADTEAVQKPKKRGRKPKAKNNEEQASLFDISDNNTSGQTAAQPIQDTETSTAQSPESTLPETTDQMPLQPQPKRRGRKPKKQIEENVEEEVDATPVPESDIVTYIDKDQTAEAAEQTPMEPVPVAESTTVTEEKADNVPEQKQPAPITGKKTFRAAGVKDTSLGTFFPQASTRKFTPRTQRQIEEEQIAISPAPLILEEPKAMPQQQSKRTQQKTIRGQRQQAFVHQQQDFFPFNDIITATGVLEIMPEGFGFLRSSDYNYLASPDDVYVAQNFIKQYALKSGDVVECTLNPPRDGEKYFPLGKVLRVNGQNPLTVRDRIPFEHLTPLFPEEKFDITSGPMANISTRIVDMFAPIGKGQRALIVAPPKTGKTILLKDIANAIASNHPDTYIIMLLIDERPEEVTDMARSVNAEVIASTFDEPAERHVKIAGIVLEKAKRLVESGHDVVIMLDSITRLARAYNTVSPASGKILSGGVDANALQRPKRFFGAARNIENGGSLTIIATALTETSSKMDEVIFEEFKGTGNMELQLDRKLSNKRLFPAVDIIASSTRREDLLTNPEILNRMWLLRKYISDMNSIEALEFIKKQMEMTKSNLEILHNMNG